MPKKQKSGLYRTKVKIGVGPDGRPLYKYVSGKTRAELEDQRRAVVARYITGEAPAEDQLFGAYAVQWFRLRKEPFVSPATRNNYRTMLNRHILPVFAERHLRAIRPADLQAFVNTFAGSSKSQISSVINTLRGVFSAAMQDGIIRQDPSAALIRPAATPPQEKRALTPEEREVFARVFTASPDGLYLAVMYYTGMRPGEVRGLMWGDIDWSDGLIHVQRDIDYAAGAPSVGSLKTRAADRYIPIADDLRVLLYPVRRAPGEFVFPGKDGKPLAQATAVRMWIRLMLECGLADPIPPDQPTGYGPGDIRGQYRPRITPHTMRHNFISMCWEAGLDIMLTMKLVGHTDYETTRNIYTHLSRRHLDQAKDQLNDVFAGRRVTPSSTLRQA